MADQLTLLENKLDERYANRRAMVVDATCVLDWPDYMFRVGYLQAIRDVGLMIKEVRNPELPVETGEIPSILEKLNA